MAPEKNSSTMCSGSTGKRRERSGRDLALWEKTSPWALFFYIDQDQGIRPWHRARLFHDERYKWFAPFGLVRYTDAEGRPWGTPGAPSRAPTLEDGVDQKVWLCGNSGNTWSMY